MGRSQMQGTPWHYEYLHTNTKKKNSINCIYNTGIKCTCSFSKHHNQSCVGENNCNDFERCSFSRPHLYTKNDVNKKTTNATNNNYVHKKNKQGYNPKITVELGNIVIVESAATMEWIDIHVTDTKNPFYMKKINDVVLIRGEKYKIVKVKKRQ